MKTEVKKIDGKSALREIMTGPRWPIYYEILSKLLDENITNSSRRMVIDFKGATKEDFETLQRYGLVHFFVNPDGTYRYLYITRKGIIIIRKIREIERQLERRFFDPAVEIETERESDTLMAIRSAVTAMFNTLEINMDLKNKIITMKDMRYLGTKNEREVWVDYSNNIHCLTCDSYSCEHVIFTKALMETLNAMIKIMEPYVKKGEKEKKEVSQAL
ncbi:MAG: hypothetical protein ACPLXM_14095 [Bacteroidales bacterium]